MRFHREYEACKLLIDKSCAALLLESWSSAGDLGAVVRRAGSLGGKRLRPVLLLNATELLGGDPVLAVPAACAVELIHTASLLLDDLPCMDDASTRRGSITSHRVFGEAATVLGSMALTHEAMQLIARSGVSCGLDAGSVGALINESVFCIREAMVGQMADIGLREAKSADEVELMRIYQMKTGALFALPVRLGARLAHASPDALGRLDCYAQGIGIAFQILDDVLDCHATTKEAGKDTRKDAGRPSAVTLWGQAGAEQHAQRLLDEALGALEPWGERAWFLIELARHLWTERAGRARRAARSPETSSMVHMHDAE
ncbi:polyprenyl synthetase family protein [Polyangium aurulentum]|uniref:polyprenyl synthetase family protein n=1 Tax=Polyangium aurulentum TaxID=2567896 RepID=UPI0010AE4B86|nr:polyprenyl synthetase family protein [Polyangium aurulentum]UQA63362.1 polyprenyl synthetase family protein [Polyangium aurulentum]